MTASTSSEYLYCDHTGDVTYKVVVKRTPTGEKSVYQMSLQQGSWVTNMQDVMLLPYQLPEALEAVGTGADLYVVEGERDVETLRLHGLKATTNTGGAGKWRDEYSLRLRGGRFVVLGDNDTIGRKHVQQVVASLREFAEPVSLKVVDLCSLMPTLPAKGDVTDFLSLGGSFEALLAAVEGAPDIVDADTSIVKHPAVDHTRLPYPLGEIINTEEDTQDRLTLLLSALVSIGAVLTNSYMLVCGRRFHPTINLMVVGAAASGKGIASVGRDLVDAVHRERRDHHAELMAAFEEELAELAGTKKDVGTTPQKPPNLALLAPGNSTGPVILELLSDNPSLLVHESEVDVTATMLRADFFDLSSVIRQCWSHEAVSYARVKLDKPIEIRLPLLALCLSGTFGQVAPFFRHSENGLVSRFMFHLLTRRARFRDPFDPAAWNGASIGTQYAGLVSQIHQYQAKVQNGIEVRFRDHQRKELFETLSSTDLLLEDDGDHLSATMRRNPVLIARIATVLTILRVASVSETWPVCGFEVDGVGRLTGGVLLVDDRDYQLAVTLGRYALDTARAIQRYLPQAAPISSSRGHPNTMAWYAALPPEVDRKSAVSIAADHHISSRTADRLLRKSNLFESTGNGQYRKCSRGEVAK